MKLPAQSGGACGAHADQVKKVRDPIRGVRQDYIHVVRGGYC
jgi:hypothetical protein